MTAEIGRIKPQRARRGSPAARIRYVALDEEVSAASDRVGVECDHLRTAVLPVSLEVGMARALAACALRRTRPSSTGQ